MVKRFIKSFLTFIIRLFGKILKRLKILKFFIDNLKLIQLEKKYFINEVSNFLKKEKVIFLDVGSLGGIEPELIKYQKFLKIIFVEPNKKNDISLKNDEKLISNALWSKKEKKNLYITKNPAGSSFYKPSDIGFKFYFNSNKYYENYKVINFNQYSCSTIKIELQKLNIPQIDLLKIDTQGSEYDVLKGMGKKLKPLFVKCEVQIFPLYKDVPLWSKILNLLDDLGYISIDMLSLGASENHMPVEADMYFIPNFFKNKEIFNDREDKFISIMLMHNQIRPLKIIANTLNFKNKFLINHLNDSYFH